MSIIDDYISYHIKYKKIYGNNSLVLIQVGSFFEAYATDTEGPDLHYIADLINIVCTRKDKKENIISKKNPYMLGFPLISYDKHVSLLVNNGYTLILIEQTTPPPNPKREVTNIISPGTYMSSVPTIETNYVVSLYFEYERQKAGLIPLLCSGMTAIDITTGKLIIYESHAISTDTEISLDDTIRFITAMQPKEIIITKHDAEGKLNLTSICNYLQLIPAKLHIITFDKLYSKINYQNEIFTTVYSNIINIISPIEYLELEKYDYARYALINLINFLTGHNNKLINCLNIPEIFIDNTNLILGNNATYQLNILELETNNTHKFKSLYDVVCNCTTAMGKRYIKTMLMAPLTDITAITKIYDRNDKMLVNNNYLELENILKKISDIEKLKRKMNLKILQPYELADIIYSFTAVEELINLCKNINITDILPNNNYLKLLNTFITHANNIFDINILKQSILNNIRSSFFKTGIYKDIDNLVNGCISEYNIIKTIAADFETKLDLTVNIKSTKSEGHYIYLTQKKYDLLITKISQQDFDKLDIKKLKNSVKIFINKNKATTEDELSKLVYNNYLNVLTELNSKYNDLFNISIKFVTLIDYSKSNAKTAKLYNYIRPKITDINNKQSYIKLKNLRHPIVERIIDYEYVPHDIEIGENKTGILLYGLNSSGKSILMKAMALSFVMIQAGMYCASTECTFYPIKTLYSRIGNRDDLYKGLSSFSLEMMELYAILKRANKNSFIVGDEICNSTEHISALSLVASSIHRLSNSQSLFVFTTHLHELKDISCIKNLTNLKLYHLSTEYDNTTDTLIYDRKLKEFACDNYYGIIVAQKIIKDKDFINIALDIKNELCGETGKLISGKTSKYNSKTFIYCCNICGKKDLTGDHIPLETHHIEFQQNCTDNFSKDKPHIKKNSQANLLVLCNECHDKIHNNIINIDSQVMTTNGKKIKLKNNLSQ